MSTLTIAHVAISLVGIAAGFVVICGLLASKRLDGWTALFLTMTVATSVTGFFFPITHLTPGLVIGVISLVTLAIAIYARYARPLAGAWRPTYVITAIIAQYLNFFVLIVQSFLKVPALHALAPTQKEAPFAIAQGVAFVAFAAITVMAAIRFRDQPA
ncbi:MAG: hypothetical protein ACT4QC_14460 [Planctomycetaceae bacterium]